jgi:hypothetical protein
LQEQPSLPIETVITIRCVIALRDAGLREALRRILDALAVFPAKPNTSSETAALAVLDGEAPLLDVCLDVGLVEATGGGRFALQHSFANYAATLWQTATAARRQIDRAASLSADRSDDLPGPAADEANALTALRPPNESEQGNEPLPVLDAWFSYFEAAGRLGALEVPLDRAVDFAHSSEPDHLQERVFEQRARARFLHGEIHDKGSFPLLNESSATHALDPEPIGSDRTSAVVPKAPEGIQNNVRHELRIQCRFYDWFARQHGGVAADSGAHGDTIGGLSTPGRNQPSRDLTDNSCPWLRCPTPAHANLGSQPQVIIAGSPGYL